ncbi:hypothetical protein AgCh_030952 [Apium graveolens]
MIPEKFSEFEVNNQTNFIRNEKIEVICDGMEESGKYWSDLSEAKNEKFVDDVVVREVKGGSDVVEVKESGDKECVDDVIRVVKVSEAEKRVRT